MKNFITRVFLAIAFMAFTTTAYASSASQSPFSLLGLANAWTAAQSHSGAETFSNANTNFSAGLKLFGVAATPVNVQTFTSTGANTWTKPTSGGHLAFIEMWAGGQSGAVRTTTGNAGGGAGGTYFYILMPLSALSSTETATVGAGGAAVASSNANGNLGTISTFTIAGVTYTPPTAGQVAPTNVAVGSAAGAGSPALYAQTPLPICPTFIQGATGGDVTTGNVPEFVLGVNSTNTLISGAAGGASSSTAGGTRTGGASFLGGAGGAGGANTGGNGTAGSQPGGGGGGAVNGGASGKGGDGQIRVTVF